MRSLELELDKNQLGNLLDFVKNSLDEYNFTNKSFINDAMMATEEAFIKLLEQSPAACDDPMTISIGKSLLGNVTIKISVPGDEFDFDKEISISPSKIISQDEDTSDDLEDTVRNIILTSLEEKLKYQYDKGVNNVLITLKKE